MHVATAVEALRELLAGYPRPIALVPTMGALHQGHLSLVQRARADCATVVASLFVNPLQFGPSEDLSKYPRDFEGDRALFEQHGVDVLFTPEVAEMYPAGFSTAVDVGAMGSRFEGAVRPTHFRGVATVVCKLLNIVQPDVMYLGQKDAQQTAVLRKVISDLSVPVEIRIVPTVRDADGLALSSRNAYLTSDQRTAAPSLYAALTALRLLLHQGMPKAEAVKQAAGILNPAAQLDYLDVVDADTFEPIEDARPPAFIVGAARFGTTRLIDNLWIAKK